MDNHKLEFVTKTFALLVKEIPAGTAPKWGKMNAQQMAEHVSDFFKVSAEKIIIPLQSSPEHLEKLKEFLLSDKQFRENTKAPANVVPEEPVPERNASFGEAVQELENEIDDFVSFFKNNPDKKTVHPVFGALNFEEWILLHYKHVSHHARQFGLVD